MLGADAPHHLPQHLLLVGEIEIHQGSTRRPGGARVVVVVHGHGDAGLARRRGAIVGSELYVHRHPPAAVFVGLHARDRAPKRHQVTGEHESTMRKRMRPSRPLGPVQSVR